MDKRELQNAHDKMKNRLEEEEKYFRIHSMDLSYGENEITLALEMNANGRINYWLQMDIAEDIVMLVDFHEDITLDDIVESYISVGDFISGKASYQGLSLGWGRLAWILDNSDPTKRKMDMMVAFVEEPSGIYDGSENHIKLSFGMDEVLELKNFIKEAYELICNKSCA